MDALWVLHSAAGDNPHAAENDLLAEENLAALTELNCALHAAVLLRRDVDYIVREERIELVDEFTGRVVKDRHWPDGLQAALEAKEGIDLRREGRTLGSIALQHFLQLYPRLCGMTGTARSAAEELKEFYGLSVVVIHRSNDKEPASSRVLARPSLTESE